MPYFRGLPRQIKLRMEGDCLPALPSGSEIERLACEVLMSLRGRTAKQCHREEGIPDAKNRDVVAVQQARAIARARLF